MLPTAKYEKYGKFKYGGDVWFEYFCFPSFFPFFYILTESADFRKNTDDWKHWNSKEEKNIMIPFQGVLSLQTPAPICRAVYMVATVYIDKCHHLYLPNRAHLVSF